MLHRLTGGYINPPLQLKRRFYFSTALNALIVQGQRVRADMQVCPYQLRHFFNSLILLNIVVFYAWITNTLNRNKAGHSDFSMTRHAELVQLSGRTL